MRHACIYRNVWGLQHHRVLAHIASPGPSCGDSSITESYFTLTLQAHSWTLACLSLRRLSKEASLDERKGRTSNRNPKLEPRLPPYLLRDKQLQYLTTCPWPSVSTWKIFRKKKSCKVPQSKTWICHLRAYIYIYFHNIYIELGIVTNFSSVPSLSHWLFATPWTAARQASLSITNSRSLLKLMSTESVMPSNHLILCRPLLLLPSRSCWSSRRPSVRVFSNESVLRIGWSKDWSFSFSFSLSKRYSGLISFRIDWFGLLVVQRTLKSLHIVHGFLKNTEDTKRWLHLIWLSLSVTTCKMGVVIATFIYWKDQMPWTSKSIKLRSQYILSGGANPGGQLFILTKWLQNITSFQEESVKSLKEN